MASTAATVYAITPIAGVDLDSKSSTPAFKANTVLFGSDGYIHQYAKAGGSLGSTANITIGDAGSAISAASAGAATYTVNTTGGVVANQWFFARSKATGFLS